MKAWSKGQEKLRWRETVKKHFDVYNLFQKFNEENTLKETNVNHHITLSIN